MNADSCLCLTKFNREKWRIAAMEREICRKLAGASPPTL